VDDAAGRVTLGRSIGRTHKFVRSWADRELAPLGASVTDYVVLFHIDAAAPPGLSQTEVARFADMGDPALVRHLTRLEADGVIRRRRDEADRRILRVTLTEAGRRRLAEIGAVMDRCDSALRAHLTDDEADVMQRALDTLFEFTLGELHRPTA
jgi:MarR family transcriptional regulator for hemolysin